MSRRKAMTASCGHTDRGPKPRKDWSAVVGRGRYMNAHPNPPGSKFARMFDDVAYLGRLARLCARDSRLSPGLYLSPTRTIPWYPDPDA